MAGVIIPRVEPEGDPAARLLWYMYADEGIKAFAPDMFALAVEASQHDEEARRDMREAYERIFRELIDDLARLRTSDREPPISDELISHGLMGAFQQMLARAALDDEYSWREVTRHTLGLFLLAPRGLPRRAGPRRAAGALRGPADRGRRVAAAGASGARDLSGTGMAGARPSLRRVC